MMDEGFADINYNKRTGKSMGALNTSMSLEKPKAGKLAIKVPDP
jgi:hypothetical protein